MAALRALNDTELSRLYPGERLIVQDVLSESRLASCQLCHQWLERLLAKAKGHNTNKTS